ncbi:MAG: PKD domain-containing protein, partial [Desulfobacterales bacterium]|nr:PKD domain-containing protein [Desulfobacterales bacterium]
PEVDAGPDLASDEGVEVALTGSFSDPDEGDTHTIAWDLGDGTTVSGTLTPSHTYDDDDVYTVTLIVTDGEGETDSDTLLVSVGNVVPTVDAGPNQASDEGDEVAFAGSFTDPGVLDTHTVEWDFGDGGTASDTLTPTHTYADDGPPANGGAYTATLTVTDDDGGVGGDTLLVSVGNVAPTVDAGPDQASDEGDELVFAGSFTDPGVLDTHTIEWDFGDGGTASGTLTPTHAYGDDDVYTVTLSVSDGTDTISDTLLVSVGNIAPTVDAGPDQSSDEGDEVSFAGSFADPGVLDTHTVEWDFGDGGTAS